MKEREKQPSWKRPESSKWISLSAEGKFFSSIPKKVVDTEVKWIAYVFNIKDFIICYKQILESDETRSPELIHNLKRTYGAMENSRNSD